MAKSRPLKIIVDTNLWISFIISNKQNLLGPLVYSGKLKLLFSKELISEIELTIAKPKLRKYFRSDALDEMLLTFEPFTDLIDVKTKLVVCRDPKDNFLLALAKDGKADYLLTGDNDLLDLKSFAKTKIVTVRNFLEMMKNRT